MFGCSGSLLLRAGFLWLCWGAGNALIAERGLLIVVLSLAV